MAHTQADWAIEIAAEVLVKNEPLTTQEEYLERAKKEGYASSMPLAAWTIGAIGYPGYPGSAEMGDYSDAYAEKCRDWWLENVHQPKQVNRDTSPAAASAPVSTRPPAPPKSKSPHSPKLSNQKQIRTVRLFRCSC